MVSQSCHWWQSPSISLSHKLCSYNTTLLYDCMLFIEKSSQWFHVLCPLINLYNVQAKGLFTFFSPMWKGHAQDHGRARLLGRTLRCIIEKGFCQSFCCCSHRLNWGFNIVSLISHLWGREHLKCVKTLHVIWCYGGGADWEVLGSWFQPLDFYLSISKLWCIKKKWQGIDSLDQNAKIIRWCFSTTANCIAW